MQDHGFHDASEICAALEEAILEAIPGAEVRVGGGGGHYSIEVVSELFAGERLLAKQRRVYSAIAHMMKGDHAPVHAIDSLQTRVKEG